MIPFAVLMAVAVPIIVLWTRMSLPKYVGRWNRKKGPPESGHMVTLVLTDVEGSTELWEAFQEVMSNTSLLTSSAVILALSSCSVQVALSELAASFAAGRHKLLAFLCS